MMRRVLLLTLIALLAPLPTCLAQTDDTVAMGEQLEARVFEISRKLRCPTCVSESVADSNAGISIGMRNEIQAQLQAGASEAEILAFFQDRYGDWILLEPPRRGIHLVVWWLPGIALAAGVIGLATLMVRWTRNAQQATHEAQADDADLARVRAALQGDSETTS